MLSPVSLKTGVKYGVMCFFLMLTPVVSGPERETMNTRKTENDGSVAPHCYASLHDEFVLTHFLAMCAESGSPPIWEQVDNVVHHLCKVRKGLEQASFERCSKAGYDYLDSLKGCG